MKTWKVRTESGTIGKIKLDEYSVYVTEENITVNIDIVQMSVAIKNELMRAVEIAKKQEIQPSIISLWVLRMQKIIV